MKRAVVYVGALALLFCALWSNPSARAAFVRHFWASQTLTYYGHSTSVGLSRTLGFAPNDVAAQRFPNDAWWQWRAELTKTSTDNDSPDYYYNIPKIPNQTYNALAARFPQSYWLRVEQFNAALPNQSWNSGRQPLPTPTAYGIPAPTILPIAVPRIGASPGAGASPSIIGAPGVPIAPPPGPTPTPYAVSESERASFSSGLAVCEQGESAEPKNTLWTWMRAHCLFRLRYDAEALRALQQGANKPFYSNHIPDEQQAALQGQQKLRALDWDEKLQLLDSSTSYAIDSRCYNVVALAVEQAEMRERAGHTSEALQIYDALTRLLRTMRLSATRNAAITSVSRAESVMWDGNRRKEQAMVLNNAPISSSVSESRSAARLRAQSANLPFVTTASLLANSARAHGRPDLASRITGEDNQMFRAYTAIRRSFSVYSTLNQDELTQVTALNWLGGTLAWQVTGITFAWGWCVLMLGLVRAGVWWRRRKATAASSSASPSSVAPTPDGTRPIGWFSLLLAALVPLAVSVGLVGAILRTDLIKGVGYEYSSDNSSHFPALALVSLFLAASATLLTVGIGAWGARRALFASQSGTKRTRNKVAAVAGSENSDAQMRDTAPSVSDAPLMTMPDEVEMSWLPLSGRAMRQLCAPFNWMLTVGMPLSWAALLLIGDRQAVGMPVAYLPGVASPVITIDAPGWGFSILLTVLVVVRWLCGIFLSDRQQWRKLKAENGIGLDPATAPIGSSSASDSGSEVSRPTKRQKRRVPRWGMNPTALGGVRDALGVALVGAFALYVAIVWAALPLRDRANGRANLIFQVGELKASQLVAKSQATGGTAPVASSVAP